MTGMTGFGYSEKETETLYLSVEIKSYNNRYLDMQVNLPPFLSPLEPKVREFLGGRIHRGRVEVYIRLRELEENLSVHLDRNAAAEYAAILRELAEHTGVGQNITLDNLLQMEGILKSSRTRDLDSYWEALKPVFEDALVGFIDSRKREGASAQEDILEHLEIIARGTGQIEAKSGDLEAFFRETVKNKFLEVVGDEVDENRVLTEIAALMVKYSINEELVRLKQHLESFRSIINTEKVLGKKLDFLAQEIHREINTLGSKSIRYDISGSVVLMKDALENIREQLRNVE